MESMRENVRIISYIRLEREVSLVENFNLEPAYVRNWKYAQLVVQF